MASVRLDDSLEKSVEEAAKREGVTRSEFIRRALQDRATRVLQAEGERSPLWERIPTIKSGKTYSLERIGQQMTEHLYQQHRATLPRESGPDNSAESD